MDDALTIGIDIGGTYVKAGICRRDGTLLLRRSIDTEGERGYAHVFSRLVRLIGDLRAAAGEDGGRIRAVGVGAPGPMSHAEGVIYSAPNLPGWENVPLRGQLAQAAGLPVSLENDANAAAYGEFAAGAGRDARSLVMITLGTGIGGGIVLDGALWRGHFDNAGEIGHTLAIPDGRACPCGQRGCLERYASAAAIGQRAAEAIRGGERSALAARLESDGELTSEHVCEAAQRGDALAARIWDEACSLLAAAIVNVQHMLNPEVVVLAGGLAAAGAPLFDAVQRHFDRQRWRIAPDMPRICAAALGGVAGTIGAALLAK